MIDLTEVILSEGKVIHREAELGLDVLSYRFGDFEIVEKSPVSVTVENIGERNIDGYNLDVDQLVHDEALLYWPERTLCREACKGLCPTCGQNLNDGSCNCTRTDLDPRMAKILDIFSNFKEV